MSDEAEPVIFELGSNILKAGVRSNEEKPSVLLRSSYSGSKQYPEFENNSFTEDENPVINYGWVNDWDAFTPLVQLAYSKMKISDIQNRPVLITMHPHRPKDSIQKLTQEMFETFQIPSLHYALKPQMSIYGCGRGSGLSVVIGHDVTSWMPIYEGFCIQSAVGSNNLGGSMITRRFQNLIQKSNSMLISQKQSEKIKEKNCFIVKNYEAEFQLQKGDIQRIALPGGSGEISAKTELFSAPEILFKPQIEGLDYYGLQYSIYDSIINSPIDIRKTLQSSILLSGGTSNLKGLADRLADELRDLDNELFARCNVMVQKDAVWTGTVTLCSLCSFLDNIVTKAAYEEYGPSVRFPLL